MGTVAQSTHRVIWGGSSRPLSRASPVFIRAVRGEARFHLCRRAPPERKQNFVLMGSPEMIEICLFFISAS
jgi:hypothetical protein